MIGLIIGAAIATKAIRDIAGGLGNSNVPSCMVTKDACDFVGMNYQEAARILRSCGFSNIEFNEIRRKENFWNRNSYKTVNRVRINGDSDFDRGTRFPVQSYVSIEVNLFLDSPALPENVLNSIPRPTPRPAANVYQDEPQAKPAAKTVKYVFCDYCDCRIPADTPVCPRCAAPITRHTYQKPLKKFCCMCGKELDYDSAFCGYCGYKC